MNPRFQIIGSSNEVEVTSGRIIHAVGRKRYELTNHLGNVLTVISDRRIAADNVGYEASPTGTYSPATGTPGLYHAFISGTTTYIQITGTDGIIDYYTAEIISSSEYSAFGVQLQDWGYQSEDYRYAFQGQDVDNELWAGAVSYKYRMEDPRLGRFFSVDPLAAKYPHNSVYAFSENRVLDAIELEGLEAYFIHGTQTPWCLDYRKYVHGKQMDIKVLKSIGETFGNKTTNQAFNWNGCNFDHCRHDGASALVEHVLKSRVVGEPITLVGHSHGGNVAIEAANILIREHNIKSTEINIVCINTPAEEDIALEFKGVTMVAVNAADDVVQLYGSDYDFDQTVRDPDLVIEYEDTHEGDFFDHYGISPENYDLWGPELRGKLREMIENRKPKDLDKVEIKVEELKDNSDTKWTKK